MDWASVWVDIAVGLLIAGALGAWVPEAFWQGSSWSTTRRTTSPGLRAELQASGLTALNCRVEVLELDPSILDGRGDRQLRPTRWGDPAGSLVRRAGEPAG